ncbi:hypothetical protein N7494_004300 [Penicillium frequentans]|uniref:Pre-mRNA splicing factor CLF1 n=1 Tax=Penicillium frequentans TaxID=3151616 RepID=A0AAD6D0D8_9EURO|nr:hypothetical protein N7494_004300 [Penicillium glabrum]
MTAPEPPMSLEGHCSAVHENTLYVYAPDGFASLSLERNANWTTLSPGAKVTGAACVTAAIEGDNDNLAFYVVGGSGNSSYSGLQRYSYQDQEWSPLSGSSNLNNLLGHGVGYLEDAATILVYGGSQNSNTASQLTYELSTSSPYDTDSKVPQGVPSAASPMLLKWNESALALVGGYTSTTEVYLYANTTGWVASGVTLPSNISSETGRFAILSDDEGNKILEDFDMDVAPNTITSYEIIKDGIALAASVVGSSSSKRSLSNYPSYNSTNAGTTIRSDYAIAQSSDDLVVISSGSGNNSVSIFNQTSNSWTNTTELFYGSGTQKVLHSTTTTTTSSTPTATASSTASTTPSSSPTAAAAAASDSSGEQVGVIIGATLGSICGAIIILVAILVLLRRKREQQNPEGERKGGDGKDRLSFQDQGIEPLTEGAYPMAKSPVPVATISDDSLAIMSGRYAGEKALRAPNQSYGYGLGKQGLSPIPSSGLAPSSMYSDDSDRSAAVAAAVEAISSPGNKPGDRTTDEGWGKYFDDNRATNLAGMQSDRSTMSSAYTKSDYRGSTAWPMSNLAPLDFGFLDQPKPLGQVNSGSPTTELGGHTGRSLFIPESQSARISSADSVSIASDDDPHDTNWTGAGHSSWLGRPSSSNYSNSYYGASNTNLPATNSQAFARNSNARKSSVIIPDNIDELPPSGNYNSDMSWLNLHAER